MSESKATGNKVAGNKLSGKTAVITGASTGIGLATAKLFASEGARVILTGRRKKELEEAVRQVGDTALGVQGDVSKAADRDRLYEAAKAAGPIDIVFANAGFTQSAPLATCTEEHFDAIFGTNVKGALFTVQRLLPLMRDGGSIILTSSVGGSKGTPGLGVYGASKAAVRSFVRTLTAELKDRGIRANAVSPGPIDTPLVADVPEEMAAKMIASIPMGRMGRDEEVARAVLFLASEDSSFVTGIELFVDGGRAQV